MTDTDFVLNEIQAGAKVRIVEDRHGLEQVEIRRGWLPIGTKYLLPRHDMISVRVALGVRHRMQSRN